MFVISQFALHKSNMCKFNNISTYAIASGLIVYASIYLYLLFYNNDYVALFNKFIIYIIGIDLLLSTFYYFNTSKKTQTQDLNFEQIPNVELLNLSNDVNINSDEESISDDDDDESEFEVETEDCEMEEINHQETLEEPTITEQLQTVDTQPTNTQPTNTELIITEQLQTVDTEQLQETLEKINSETNEEVQKNVQLSGEVTDSTKINLIGNLDLDSEQVIKKRRGRKPNHLKIQGV
jgi:hypothetical protein